MAYRYALYTRRKEDDCFTFSMSFPTLKLALEQKQDNDKRFSNIESVILESATPLQPIDPYHSFFAQKEMVEA